MTAGLSLRVATAGDAAAMLRIYAPIVKQTAISFEWEVPRIQEIRRRIKDTLPRLPWFVCTQDAEVAGYTYASPFRRRAAYRWCVETSVYVDRAYRQKGIARALYSLLLDTLRMQGYVAAFACIALPNGPSVALHESFGFRQVGLFNDVGFKLGRWHDVSWWQLGLTDAGTTSSLPEPTTIENVVHTPGWQAALDRASRQVHL